MECDWYLRVRKNDTDPNGTVGVVEIDGVLHVERLKGWFGFGVVSCESVVCD